MHHSKDLRFHFTGNTCKYNRMQFSGFRRNSKFLVQTFVDKIEEIFLGRYYRKVLQIRIFFFNAIELKEISARKNGVVDAMTTAFIALGLYWGRAQNFSMSHSQYIQILAVYIYLG